MIICIPTMTRFIISAMIFCTFNQVFNCNALTINKPSKSKFFHKIFMRIRITFFSNDFTMISFLLAFQAKNTFKVTRTTLLSSLARNRNTFISTFCTIKIRNINSYKTSIPFLISYVYIISKK